MSAHISDPKSVVLVLSHVDDVILADDYTELLLKFQAMNAKIVFGACYVCQSACGEVVSHVIVQRANNVTFTR